MREAKKLTITQVARALKCSEAKVSRIEAGKHAVQPADVRTLLDLYDIPSEHDREAFVTLARESGQAGWWYTYGDALPAWFEVYVGLETDATELRAFSTQVVPGLFQTEEYATALLRAGQPFAPAEEIARQAALRLARQQRLHGERPLQVRAVIGEAVLLSRAGTATVMIEQLAQLHKLAQLRNIEIRVLPLDSPASAAVEHPFFWLGFAYDNDPGLVYLEHHSGSLYIDNPKEIASYRLMFDYLVAAALDPVSSAVRIEAAGERWQSVRQ